MLLKTPARTRRMVRRVAALALSTLLAVALAACATGGAPAATPAPAQPAAQQPAAQQPAAQPAASAAPAQTYQWRLATQLPTTHFTHPDMERFAAVVAERTGGRVKIDIFPGSQLYDMRQIPEALSSGMLDLGMGTYTGFAAYAPTVLIFDVPFLVAGPQQMYALLDGEFGQTLAADLEKKGIKVLAWLDFGPTNYLTNPRPVTRPADFQGLRVRVPGGLFTDSIQALGGTPVSISPDETYLALQRGTAEGVLTSATSMVSRKFYEVQKYLTLLNQSYASAVLAMNAKLFDSLPADVQQVLLEAGREVRDSTRRLSTAAEAEAVQTMRDAGLEVHEVNAADLPQWQQALKPVWDAYVEQAGETGRQLLDQAVQSSR